MFFSVVCWCANGVYIFDRLFCSKHQQPSAIKTCRGMVNFLSVLSVPQQYLIRETLNCNRTLSHILKGPIRGPKTIWYFLLPLRLYYMIVLLSANLLYDRCALQTLIPSYIIQFYFLDQFFFYCLALVCCLCSYFCVGLFHRKQLRLFEFEFEFG